MSRASTAKSSSRIIRTADGFQIYAGPCNSCPDEVEPWIRQFCRQPQNSWYAAIDPEWAADWFNQYGINNHFDDFDLAIELISDHHSGNWSRMSETTITTVHQEALRIYGLLHARWICQPRGMAQMKEKYEKGVFGHCPRYSCKGTKVIPMGQTLTMLRHSVKMFCPNCSDIYRPPADFTLDGAHFGPAFPHMFLSEYQQFDKSRDFVKFEVKAFGFKIHRSKQDRFLVHDKNRHEDEYPEDEGVV